MILDIKAKKDNKVLDSVLYWPCLLREHDGTQFLKIHLQESYKKLEACLEEVGGSSDLFIF